jgi:hypothetical protein
MSIDEMHNLVKKHSDCETNLDLEGVLGTLIDNPVYEFHPARLKLEGKENIKQFYHEHFYSFFPLINSHTLINECWDSHSACMEYDLSLKAPHNKKTYRIMVILTKKESLLVGERFYVDIELAQLMAGKSFDKFVKF